MKDNSLQLDHCANVTAGVEPTKFPQFACCQGFTLVELIVVIAIFSVVMTGVYSVFVRSNRAYISQEQVVAAQQEARSALDILGREIRMAGFIADNNKAGGLDVISTPAYPGGADSAIEIATVDAANKTTTLAFKADLDGDGQTDAVRYVYYHGDHATASRRFTLYRELRTYNAGWADPAGGEQLFLENIQSLDFDYQLADGTPPTPTPADLEDIRGVVISITVQTAIEVNPYGDRGFRYRELVSNVQIRNLGLS